jgi:hypothetical protein
VSASALSPPRVAGPCRHCGRVAEGFPGDYASCPHCHKMTKLPPQPPPGWRLVHRVGQLASIPYYMVTLFYSSIVAIAWTGGGTGLGGGTIVVLVFAAWIFTIMRFGAAAEHQPGWWFPVVAYHLSSFLVPVAFWLAARGCAAVSEGAWGLAGIGSILGALAVSGVCLLAYGVARGRTARLRVVRDA